MLVPRETPLSTIHLENLLRLRRAGATVVMAAPGFYHAPQTIDDLVDFVVARCLDQLGIDQTLVEPVGTVSSGTLAPAGRRGDVRPDLAGLRRDEPADDRRARPALAAADRAGRRPPGRPRARRVLRHRRSRAGGRAGRRPRHRRSTSPSACSSGRAASRPRWSGCGATCSRCPFADASFDAATVGFGDPERRRPRGRPARARARAPAGRSARLPRDHPSARGPAPVLLALVRRARAGGREVLPGGAAYTYLPASVRRFPGPEELGAAMRRRGLRRRYGWRLLGGGIVALHAATRSAE